MDTSSVGAMGLMQVMPETYDGLRARYDLGDDPYEPRDNLLAGTGYLREMYDVYGFPGFLAAYNAGPHRLDDYLTRNRPLPDETRNYVRKIGPYIAGIEPNRPSPASGYAMNQVPLNIPPGPRYPQHQRAPVALAENRRGTDRRARAGADRLASRAAPHGAGGTAGAARRRQPAAADRVPPDPAGRGQHPPGAAPAAPAAPPATGRSRSAPSATSIRPAPRPTRPAARRTACWQARIPRSAPCGGEPPSIAPGSPACRATPPCRPARSSAAAAARASCCRPRPNPEAQSRRSPEAQS